MHVCLLTGTMAEEDDVAIHSHQEAAAAAAAAQIDAATADEIHS